MPDEEVVHDPDREEMQRRYLELRVLSARAERLAARATSAAVPGGASAVRLHQLTDQLAILHRQMGRLLDELRGID